MSHAFVCLAPAPTPTSSSGTAPSTSAARTSAASTSASSSRGAQRNQQRKTKQTCERVFPSAHLLSLHETEWHDPLAAIRREKGERIVSPWLLKTCCEPTADSLLTVTAV